MVDLNYILSNFNSQFEKISERKQLEDLKIEFLGKKGQVTTAFTQIKEVAPEERKTFGATINQIKTEISSKIEN